MPETIRVAVIGGGYAGMAAAVELAGHGIDVAVFDAARQLGGRARRVDYRETALDNGLHILLGAYRATLRLIELVNPAYKTALLRLPLAWNMHDEFSFKAARLPAPLNLLLGLLRASGASLRDRLAAIRFIAALRHTAFTLEHDTSVERLLKQHGQSEQLCRVLWRPLCVAALNTSPAVASARIFLNVVRDSLGGARDASDLLIPRVDLSALFPEPAAAWIVQHGGQVLRAQRVTAIDQTANGFSIETHDQRLAFSHVICALPPHQVYAFLIGITALSEIAAIVERLQYEPIYSVWLQYAERAALPAPMLGFTNSAVQWVFDRGQLCGQHGLLGAVISARGAHQNLSQDELALCAHHELQQRFTDLPPLKWHKVIAEKRATFSCTVGTRRPPQLTPLTNFYLAGDYTASDYPGTIEAAVLSGIVCARHIRAASGA